MGDNPGGYVYGTILVAALLAAESPGSETYGRTVAGVGLALVLYWLAAAYARDVGRRVSADEHGHFSFAGFRDVAVHELAVVVGALGPLVAVALCWASGASLQTGVVVAVWVAAGIIVLTEVGLAVRSHLRGIDLLVQMAVGVALGVAVVALRVLLH